MVNESIPKSPRPKKFPAIKSPKVILCAIKFPAIKFPAIKSPAIKSPKVTVNVWTCLHNIWHIVSLSETLLPVTFWPETFWADTMVNVLTLSRILKPIFSVSQTWHFL